jgi:hypothetical protein
VRTSTGLRTGELQLDIIKELWVQDKLLIVQELIEVLIKLVQPCDWRGFHA